MNRILFFSLTICFLFNAFAEDTIRVVAHKNTQMVWHVNYDNKVHFPTEGKTFRKIYMHYTLGCANTGCSHWDYDVLTQIMHNTGERDSNVTKLDTISQSPLVVDTVWNVFDVLEPYELGRLITPYGNYMDFRDYPNGINGFDSSWKHTFIYDVTDYVSLLKDSVIIRSKYNGWSSGFSATIRFDFIEGTPQRDVISIQNIYANGGGYQNSEQFETYIIPAKTFPIPLGTKSAQAKVIITGHGNNESSNCGEFCDKEYYFKVNGNKEFTYRMWREDCGAVPVRPQGGTYLYPRANWCPGDKVHEQRWELTPFLSGDSITLDMDIEAYTNAGNGGSSHNISSTVFFYGDDNYQFDAELHTILAPSSLSEHINYNPSCGEVIVVIKNNSRTPLTYSKIEYGPEGGKMRVGEWSGNLEFEQMDTVYLPPPYWNGIDPSQTRFVAKLFNQNHRYGADQNLLNDAYTSSMELAPRWEPFRIQFRTNGQPQENRISITNHKGEVVWELDNLSPNTSYNEIIDLPNGCYQFLLSDEGEDGLHWWVYAQTGQNTRTNGSLRVMKQTGAGIYINVSDFGREVRENFIIGDMTVEEAPLTFADEIDVFPNPSTSGEFNILIPAWNEGMATITVIDRLGRIVLYRENTPTDKEHWEVLKIKELEDSFYFIKVQVGDKIRTRKVFISDN